MFCAAVARRPLRTENHRTPMQMWIGGQTLDPAVHLSNQVSIMLFLEKLFIATNYAYFNEHFKTLGLIAWLKFVGQNGSHSKVQ